MENSTYRRIIDNIEKNRQRILDAERHIWANPEIGYKEWKTTEYMAGIFTELGYTVTRPENITGFIADLDTGRPGPKVAIVAELDSLICAEHPECDPITHAVHACGHHAQSAYLVGCAAAFAEPGALKDLCGSIRFISVPAEETIDLEFRNKLIEDGVIHYPAGKVEFLYRGLFDGVDIAMMNHVTPDDGNYLFDLHGGSDGCIVKHFEFKGAQRTPASALRMASTPSTPRRWASTPATPCVRNSRRGTLSASTPSSRRQATRPMRSPRSPSWTPTRALPPLGR